MKRDLTGCFKPTQSSRLPVRAKKLKLRVPTVTSALTHLAKLGIVRETTGRNYRRLYAYAKYLKLLNDGTEPLN